MALSASIFCARVMRGMASMASTVALRSARWDTSSLLWPGQMKEMRAPPSFMRSASCLPSVRSMGARTLRIRSASAYRVAASGTTVAPTSAYVPSMNCAPSPAPASTSTSRPSLSIRLTMVGVAATRRSPGAISLGIPTFIEENKLLPAAAKRKAFQTQVTGSWPSQVRWRRAKTHVARDTADSSPSAGSVPRTCASTSR